MTFSNDLKWQFSSVDKESKVSEGGILNSVLSRVTSSEIYRCIEI